MVTLNIYILSVAQIPVSGVLEAASSTLGNVRETSGMFRASDCIIYSCIAAVSRLNAITLYCLLINVYSVFILFTLYKAF